MIGRSGERGSGISVLAVRHDDDDDDWFTPGKMINQLYFSQFNLACRLFAYSLNVKQFYLTF